VTQGRLGHGFKNAIAAEESCMTSERVKAKPRMPGRRRALCRVSPVRPVGNHPTPGRLEVPRAGNGRSGGSKAGGSSHARGGATWRSVDTSTRWASRERSANSVPYNSRAY
jgi:hypothetical protein